MIFVMNTPNSAGVSISGDYLDFDALYKALHAVVGGEGEHCVFEGARIRVMAVCYDLRHALMGDREIEFVENGMDGDKMRRLSTITSDTNVYLRINVLWPEILFVTSSLNDFVRLYGRKQAKNSYDFMMDKRNIWDVSLAQVRMFQAAIAKCIKENISGASFSRMMNMMNKDYTWFENYITQYVDFLNCRFLVMDKEKRLKSIPTMAKRLTEQGDEYCQMKSEILRAAREYNCPADNIEIQGLEYPEDIEW